MIAFANWAYLNDQAEQEYIKTGDFNDNAWKSGSKAWVIDVVCIEKAAKMIHWLRHKFKQVKWLKLNKQARKIGSKGF